MQMCDHELVVRPVQEKDLRVLWEMIHQEENPEWKKWDAPYFEHKRKTYPEYLAIKESIVAQDDYWAIEVNGEVIGTVSYYWEHEPSLWLEMGIAIYKPQYWSGGYGTRVLRMWMERLFTTLPIARVGFTTWSGNHRMMKVGEKLGMKLEGRMRKCRYYNGVFYDSIRMGMLREEWEDMYGNQSEQIVIE